MNGFAGIKVEFERIKTDYCIQTFTTLKGLS